MYTDVFLCEECAWTNEFPEGGSHLWWHSLLPFDSRNLDILESNGQAPLAQLRTDLDSKPTDITVVDGRTVESISARQNSSLLPIDTGPTLAKTLPITHNSEVMESVEELKSKVLSLEEKITLMTKSNAQAHDIDGIKQRMDAMEAKLTGVEDKLNKMMVHLRTVMDTLLVTRS
jgi:hypothetical protein